MVLDVLHVIGVLRTECLENGADVNANTVIDGSAVKQLVRYVTWWKDRPKDVRKDRHRKPPTMPIPWGQRPL